MGYIHAVFIVFDILTITTGLMYVYYWVLFLVAVQNDHIDNRTITNEHLAHLFMLPDKDNFFLVEIVTKGNAAHVINRGIDNIREAITKYPSLKKHVKIEVYTQSPTDVKEIQPFGLDVQVIAVPEGYKTPNNTLLKARALHYAVEQHRKKPIPHSYIIHYDEESVFTPENFARLVAKLITEQPKLTAGVISYGNDWYKANSICRTMESNRPFNCVECYLLMNNPPTIHLHGSNLVIQGVLENEIGWDIGTLDGQPLIAEDLVFGLMAYIKHGSKIFGWHHVEMIEQPPFTLRAALRQRDRWVFGSLQATKWVSTMPEWEKLSTWQKIRVKWGVYYKVLTFFLGFPLSLFTITFTLYILSDVFMSLFTGHRTFHTTFWTYVLLPGLFFWMGAIQTGLYYNLRYSVLTRWQKMREHIQVVIITPVAGICESYAASKAVVKWVFGKREVVWIPTPK